MQNRESIIRRFAESMVHDMDGDTLVMYALEKLEEDYERYSDAELLSEVTEFYPDILEEFI